ncbi:rab11 family-interacting protein 5 isoform X2 [Mastacembelus armatus]|uniref:RAB11 family interacting protein 5a (class I) n=1 Tax=Mastacembelus armatus TaxID=205130 RepID=A0A3Q3KFG4_9TELE|nr:rab11 family-interacting protein 5 isoform X2 [Mastacembelus armatus]
MSSLKVEEDQKWVPTHVQVTVLRGRGLRGKGKHGTSDVYTIIQLGKEKYSTCVVEKTTEPEWKEECSFELQPGVLESGCPAGSNELILTVMHRALMGLDVFLGQAVIQLDKVFHESRCVKNQWYRLNSKMGKKEKERGEIQVTIQFTRNNLTASMYDLVMKDKSAFTFSKLKERMRGKRRASDEDSSSAVLPSGYGSLYRMRQRLPSDGGGEEDYEDDEGGEARRSKMRTFFLRGKLRKSSDTRSSTSLGSESSESSSRGGSLSPTAGISVVVSDLSNSPSNSSNLTVDNSPEHTANTSPRSASLKCEFGDELGEITIAVPQPTLCVNGSHAYKVHPPDPGSGKANTLGVGVLQKSLPLSMSLQNLSPQPSTDLPKGPVGDGRRWSFDKPGEEEKAAIVAALEQSGHMLDEEENHLGQAAPPKAVSTTESESQGKKQRRHLFSPGRSESAGKGHSQSKDESEQAPVAAEEKHKGWFGSKDSHTKPSPHLVKPLTTATTAEEKRAEGRSVLATSLEKFKSTIHPGRSSQPSEQETDRKKSLTEGAGSYYHLTHSELVSLLVKRETELERQKVEFERQKILLAKREVELKKLKPQIKDLEDYIDTLLVRIMEQKPTLLQVHSKFK